MHIADPTGSNYSEAQHLASLHSLFHSTFKDPQGRHNARFVHSGTFGG